MSALQAAVLCAGLLLGVRAQLSLGSATLPDPTFSGSATLDLPTVTLSAEPDPGSTSVQTFIIGISGSLPTADISSTVLTSTMSSTPSLLSTASSITESSSSPTMSSIGSTMSSSPTTTVQSTTVASTGFPVMPSSISSGIFPANTSSSVALSSSTSQANSTTAVFSTGSVSAVTAPTVVSTGTGLSTPMSSVAPPFPTTGVSSSSFAIFIIDISVTVSVSRIQRRQSFAAGLLSGTALNSDGSVQSSCQGSSRYVIDASGRLLDIAGGQIAAPLDVDFSPFSLGNGAVQTSWSPTSPLAWNNQTFANGTASFCQITTPTGSQYINTVFRSAPANCVPVRLVPGQCSPSPTNNTTINVNNTTINNVDTTTINNYNVNTNIVNVLPPSIVQQFQSNTINYYSSNEATYYAQLCKTCHIVEVFKVNNTFVNIPCETCPPEVQQIPSFTAPQTTPAPPQIGSEQPAVAATVVYQPCVCLSCQDVTHNDIIPGGVQTVEVDCGCPAATTVTLSAPCTASASIVHVAVQSGAPAAAVAASQALASAPAVVTAAPNAAAAASSTIVNAPCSTCAAGSSATVVSQTAATPDVPVGKDNQPAAADVPASTNTPISTEAPAETPPTPTNGPESSIVTGLGARSTKFEASLMALVMALVAAVLI